MSSNATANSMKFAHFRIGKIVTKRHRLTHFEHLQNDVGGETFTDLTFSRRHILNWKLFLGRKSEGVCRASIIFADLKKE